MPTLRITLDGVDLKEIPLTKARTTLGRRPYNDIVVDNLAVSGEHAVFVRHPDGLEVQDLHSTNGTYLQAHLHQQFRKLMLTQIWQVQLLGIKENGFINHLYTDDGGHFTELGYGIDNILRFLRLEGAFAFRDGRYYDWGIRLSISSSFGGGIIQIE